MNHSAPSSTAPAAAPDARRLASQAGQAILQHEADALQRLARELDHDAFADAVTAMEGCRGSVIVSGMGKAGLIGQKIAATLASTGTRSHFLHPAEAVHGDLGRIHADDMVLLLSYSGETEEIVRLLAPLAEWKVPVIAITGRPRSRLGRYAQMVLTIGEVEEAGSLRLAPSTSTTAMLALGDALALVVSQRRGFTPVDFARYHPGGALGRQLARVQDVMRPLEECRVGHQMQTVREVLVSVGRPGRRSGAILLTNSQQRLVGIFTDSDLARLLEQQQDSQLDQPIFQVMTCSPWTVECDTMMTAAIRIMKERKISELPVIDAAHRPLGLIDITDVVGSETEIPVARKSAPPVPSNEWIDEPPAPQPLRIFRSDEPTSADAHT